ncbi:MAG: dihydroneopterin aldolase [Chitinophagaceae bacterium]|nr:dihydroneopterin aldolase [Chitinophagaceae bacterium]
MKKKPGFRRNALFGHYGYYTEERMLLTELKMDLSLDFKIPDKELLNLEDSLNYETIYKLIQSEMKQPEALLENIAKRVLQTVKRFDSRVENCQLTPINKFNCGAIQNVALKFED